MLLLHWLAYETQIMPINHQIFFSNVINVFIHNIRRVTALLMLVVVVMVQTNAIFKPVTALVFTNFQMYLMSSMEHFFPPFPKRNPRLLSWPIGSRFLFLMPHSIISQSCSICFYSIFYSIVVGFNNELCIDSSVQALQSQITFALVSPHICCISTEK